MSSTGLESGHRDGETPSGTASDIQVRITFGLFLVIGFALGVVMQNNYLEWLIKWAINKDGDCGTDTCVGNQSAYRISFALFIFFLFHYIMSHSMNCCLGPSERVNFNRPKGILFRVIGLVVLIIIAFLIPNAFFSYFAWFALVVSCFFLIGQLIIFLEFAYAWNDQWKEKEDSKYTYGLLAVTIVVYVSSVVLLGYLFKWFGNDSSCSTGQGVLIVILLMGIVCAVLSVWAPHGSLLPASLVFLYTTWLAYSGLSSGQVGGVCNTIQSSGTTQMIAGAIVSGLSLVVAATNAGTSKEAFELSSSDPNKTDDEVKAESYQFFHLMMTMGSCYLAMLLTSWAITGSSGIGESTDSGKASMGVKIGSGMLCIVFYMWTLVAPKLCPDRDFG